MEPQELKKYQWMSMAELVLEKQRLLARHEALKEQI
jgi:hypothetical protein